MPIIPQILIVLISYSRAADKGISRTQGKYGQTYIINKRFSCSEDSKEIIEAVTVEFTTTKQCHCFVFVLICTEFSYEFHASINSK